VSSAAASLVCEPICERVCVCCRRVVRDTSSWTNKKESLEAEQASCSQLAAALEEVDEAGMRVRMQRASEERDEAQAACTRCGYLHPWLLPWWQPCCCCCWP
jgi:hypothetical protein